MAFSADGRLFAAGIPTTGKNEPAHAKVWDAATGRCLQILTVPKGTIQSVEVYAEVNALTFTADGRELVGVSFPYSAGAKAQLLRWDLTTGVLRSQLVTDQLKVMDSGTTKIRLVGNGEQALIESPSHLMSMSHLCDLSGPQPRVQQSFSSLAVPTSDGSRLAVDNNLAGFGAIFAMIARPGQAVEKEPPTIRLVNLDTLDTRRLCSLSWLDGSLDPIAFSADDSDLVVGCHYSFMFPFRKDWYKPVLSYVLEPQCSLHLYDVASGRRQARLLGSKAQFTTDGTALVTFEIESPKAASIDGSQIMKEPGPPPDLAGFIRVYDYPLRTPWLAILAWTLLPTAATVFLIWLLQRGRARKNASLA